MQLPCTYTQITTTQIKFNDIEKIRSTSNLIKSHTEPVFAHIHWMGTHGSKFYPTTTVFSKGVDRTTQDPWNQDLYDDAILDLDNAIANLYTNLVEIDEAENTVILITSDHGQKFTVTDRLPLIILFPNSQLRDNPVRNTQNLDISPTILDILNIPKPPWMIGQSIFSNPTPHELIFSASAEKSMMSEGKWVLDPKYIEPPFYQFDRITTINCDKSYTLNLQNLSWSEQPVKYHKGTCIDNEYLSPSKVRNAIIERLKKDKFEFDVNLVPEIQL
jgi:membrane-anchored protein YejM (alkaline phosphatase superfamily)